MKAPGVESELIGRLIKDDRREEAWQQIKACEPTLPARELIDALVVAWLSSQATADRLKAWAEWRKEMRESMAHAVRWNGTTFSPPSRISLSVLAHRASASLICGA